MPSLILSLLVLPFSTLVSAIACPFGQAAEAGLLNQHDLDSYKAVKRDGPTSAAFAQLHKKDAALDERGLLPGLTLPGLSLPLGGGLLNGVLKPLTGKLSLLVPPAPQSHSLKAVPGNNPTYQYLAPGRTDQRGVCPGLNTLANHGYISRNGITTWAEAGNAIQTGFGFGYDLATVLSAIGLLSGGDLISGKYSIGGADSRVPNTLGPSLGLDRHGECEVDNSITREDTYFGNQADFQMSRWQALLKTASSHSNLFSQATFTDEKKRSYDDSRATNPSFNAGPKWFVIAHGERVFVYRTMINGTAPDKPNFANIAPFFLNETFPEHWYTRSTGFYLSEFFIDINTLYLGSPVELGGNEGLNNFVPLGITPSTMTPSQLACFALENILDNAAGSIAPAIVNNFDLVQGFLNGAVAPFFATYNCDLSSYSKPSPSAGQDTTGSKPDSGPVIVNGVYQPS